MPETCLKARWYQSDLRPMKIDGLGY